MNTVAVSEWQRLVDSQMQRALAGDAQAAKWCAEHRPDATAPSGRAAEIHREIATMNSDELRARIAETIARIESRVDVATCPHCGKPWDNLLAGKEQDAD
jgi:hypothetical protein